MGRSNPTKENLRNLRLSAIITGASVCILEVPGMIVARCRPFLKEFFRTIAAIQRQPDTIQNAEQYTRVQATEMRNPMM